MKLFGLSITRAKTTKDATNAVAPNSASTWYPLIRESFAGAWQRNITVDRNTVLAYSAVFACITLIATDIAKLRLKLTARDSNGIWNETESPAFSPVLRKPNHYQTRIKFFEQWLISKLVHGNAYIVKERDARNVVKALYVLDPCRVKPLVAPDGSVFYELSSDYLSGIQQANVVVPASEIIHDIACALFHPLCGVSPLFACGLTAMQGINIQNHSAAFFANSARPGGILTAPGIIDDVTAKRLKDSWQEKFGGANAGLLAVLGDGLKFEQMAMTAQASQLIEQLKLTSEIVCSCFHVPPHLVGAAPPPAYGNVESVSQAYLGQCLQSHIESIELLLDEGLGLQNDMGVEFDLDGILRMDYATKVKATVEGIGGALFTSDEGRRKFDLPPLKGGNTVYMQQQNYSLAALADRDAKEDPFASKTAPTPQAEPPALPAPEPTAAKAAEVIDAEFTEIHAEIAGWSLSAELKALPALLEMA